MQKALILDRSLKLSHNKPVHYLSGWPFKNNKPSKQAEVYVPDEAKLCK